MFNWDSMLTCSSWERAESWVCPAAALVFIYGCGVLSSVFPSSSSTCTHGKSWSRVLPKLPHSRLVRHCCSAAPALPLLPGLLRMHNINNYLWKCSLSLES